MKHHSPWWQRGNVTVFYLRLFITHQQEGNVSCVAQLQCFGRESHSFVLPLGWITRDNEMQSQIHVFLSDNEGPNRAAWQQITIFTLVHLTVRGCISWYICETYDRNNHFHLPTTPCHNFFPLLRCTVCTINIYVWQTWRMPIMYNFSSLSDRRSAVRTIPVVVGCHSFLQFFIMSVPLTLALP